MATWGIVPAAGAGQRIQPLAFSKELLPVGSRIEQNIERPRAVSEYLVERLVLGGADRICFVISPGKSDILQYYGGEVFDTPICYVVQSRPAGLCDALFRAAPLVAATDSVLIGLPDTVWFPIEALRQLPTDRLALLLFPVEHPELFDAVVTKHDGSVVEVQVKHPHPSTPWVWGAVGMPGSVFHDLRAMWLSRPAPDEYLGTLINGFLESGGNAVGVRVGESYVDVGTLHGYREALRLLQRLANRAARRQDLAPTG